ncbi:MAG: hypothetical protein ABIZ56_08675 [Chthoniobacteraceae bacterium]
MPVAPDIFREARLCAVACIRKERCRTVAIHDEQLGLVTGHLAKFLRGELDVTPARDRALRFAGIDDDAAPFGRDADESQIAKSARIRQHVESGGLFRAIRGCVFFREEAICWMSASVSSAMSAVMFMVESE